MLCSQRFRDENVTIEPVCQAESRSDPEWQPNIDVAQQTAEAWTKNETKSERYADHSESAGAFFPRDDVGDVSHRRWNTGGSDSGDDAAKKKPANRRRKRHDNVVQAETKI